MRTPRTNLKIVVQQQDVLFCYMHNNHPTDGHAGNGIQLFNHPAFGAIRTAGTPDNPVFCLADVCRAVELDPGQVSRRLSDGVCSKHPISDSLGREQVANFVNEDGLYDVILDSRKSEARAFRKWITSEVLPAIRRTGGYIAAREEESEADLMARALSVAQRTLEARRQRIQML